MYKSKMTNEGGLPIDTEPRLLHGFKYQLIFDIYRHYHIEF